MKSEGAVSMLAQPGDATIAEYQQLGCLLFEEFLLFLGTSSEVHLYKNSIERSEVAKLSSSEHPEPAKDRLHTPQLSGASAQTRERIPSIVKSFA